MHLKSVTKSSDETLSLGYKIGSSLASGTILCFFGDLGAGKTTLIKGIVQGATGISPEEVNSPTFSYLNIYEGPCVVYHFDLYRLNDAEDFLSLGFEEFFYAKGICCLEWSEKIESLLPQHASRISLKIINQKQREIYYEISKCTLS